MALEQHSRICPGVLIPAGAVWASQPMKLDFVRYGTFHVRPTRNIAQPNAGPATIKVQGSNVYQIGSTGGALDVNYDPVRDKGTLEPGSGLTAPFAAISNLGWADTGFSFQYPADATQDMLFPLLPMGGPPVSFDYAWIRIVVSGTGPSGITLDVWAKFKSGGG